MGLIYYRTDLIDTLPHTWDDLTTISLSRLAKPHPAALQYGYVWQGAQYEGLVCNFDEVLRGYGGTILDPDDPTRVTVNSPEGIQALTTMASWVNGAQKISPPDTSTYNEEVTRKAWENGLTIFMRNWPYAYADAQNNKDLRNKFAIHPMLYGGSNTVGHSSLGGWQLAINAFINKDRQAAAWQFLQFMIGPQAQKSGALNASWTVALRSIYQDAEVLKKVPLFQQIGPIIDGARARPVTPRYQEVSQAIRQRVREALNVQKTPEQALQALEQDLQPLVAAP